MSSSESPAAPTVKPATRSPLYDFVAFDSRWRGVWMLLFPPVFAVLVAWMLGLFGDAPEYDVYSNSETALFLGGWTLTALLGLCSVVGVWRFFDTREQLRITPLGIRSAPWSGKTIPWAEIADITVGEKKRRPPILLHLHHPDRFPPHRRARLLGRARRLSSDGGIAISMRGIDCTQEEVMTAIHRFRHLRGGD